MSNQRSNSPRLRKPVTFHLLLAGSRRLQLAYLAHQDHCQLLPLASRSLLADFLVGRELQPQSQAR
jgi:hypothetical protein